MTRDDARRAFMEAGLTYEIVTNQNLAILRRMLNESMKKSALMNGTYRMHRSGSVKWSHGDKWAAVECRSGYFEEREAVTFNRDGFIALGGWADDQNIVPILEGFVNWVGAMKVQRGSTTPVQVAA